MKILTFFSLFIFSATVMAGTCFRADNLSEFLPETICVDSYDLELVIPSLPNMPYYQVKISSTAGSIEEKANFLSTRKNEVIVNSTLVFIEEDEGACGPFFQSSLVFEFSADLKGKVLANSLSVTGVELQNGDTCHTQPTETITTYSLTHL